MEHSNRKGTQPEPKVKNEKLIIEKINDEKYQPKTLNTQESGQNSIQFKRTVMSD